MSIIEDFFKLLNEKTHDGKGEFGYWLLVYNEMSGCYDNAVQAIVESEAHESVGPWLTFETPEMRQQSIDENSIYYLQWYPRTPLCFETYAAPTLEDLARWVIADTKSKEDK